MATSPNPEEAPLLRELDAGVLTLTLNRPDRLNALSHALYDALLDALDEAEQNPKVRAIVLTGAGRAFCAGGDVKRMAGPAVETLSYEQRVARLRKRSEIGLKLHRMDKPSIAMMRGAAIGAGMSIALACDLRFGDETVKMRTGFLQIASSGDFGGHYFLPRVVGPAKARELYLTSPMLDARACESLGLLNRLCDASSLQTEVMAVAKQWAEGPATALGYLKRNLATGLEGSLEDVLDAEAWRHVRCTETPDHHEAARAFVEKRPPRFASPASDSNESKPE